MASAAQQCRKTDGESTLPPVVQFTQSLNTLPTLNIVASFGQWYPEELQSCFSADETELKSQNTLNHQEVVLSGQHPSFTSADRSETKCSKKLSIRNSSNVKSERQKTKHDAAQAVWSSSKYGRVLHDRAERLDKSTNSQSVRISNSPRRVEGGERRSSSEGHLLESGSVKRIKCVTSAGGEQQSYSRQTSQAKKSDVLTSVQNTNMCHSTSENEHSSETICTAIDRPKLFQSDAVTRYSAAERTKEQSGNEQINFVVKLQPLLIWTDVLTSGSNACFGELLEADVSVSNKTNESVGDCEALVDSAVHGGTEVVKSDFELLPADNNAFGNKPLSKLCGGNINGKTTPVGIKCKISNYDVSSVQNGPIDVTPRSVLRTNSNHLQTEVVNNTTETRHFKNTGIHRNNMTRIYVNTDVFNIHTRNRRRCFSCGSLGISHETASIDGSLARASSEAGYTGGRRAAMQCGGNSRRDSPSVGEPVSEEGGCDTGCVPLLPVASGNYDAPLTDAASQPPPQPLTIAADRLDNGGPLTQTPPMPPPSDNELCWQTVGGAFCYYPGMETVGGAEAAMRVPRRRLPLQSNFAGCAAVVGGILATGASGPPPDEFTSVATVKSPPSADGLVPCSAADSQTAAWTAWAASPADDTASYLSEQQLCCLPWRHSDSAMGQSESSTDAGVNMQQKNTVESLDISSTLAVSIHDGSGSVADVGISRSSGHCDEGSTGAGWDSVLNPAPQSGGSAVDMRPACDAATSAVHVDNDDSGNGDPGQVTADTLGWSPCTAAPSHDSQPAAVVPDLCRMTSTGVQPAVDSGSEPAALSQVHDDIDQSESGNSVDECSVQTADVRNDSDSREGIETGTTVLDDRDANKADDRCVEYRLNNALDDDYLGRPRASDEPVKCSGSNILPTGPQSAVNTTQQGSSLSSDELPPPAPRLDGGEDAGGPQHVQQQARDVLPFSAVSAGVTDAGLAGGGPTPDTAQLNPTPPGVATSAAEYSDPSPLNSDRRRPMEPLTDDPPVSADRHTEHVVESDPGGTTTVSDVACADAVSMAGPPRPCSAEAFSTSPSSHDTNDHVYDDNSAQKCNRLPSSSDAPDDDEVDKKLADELERLKNLVASSPTTCDDQPSLSVSQPPDNDLTSAPDPEESCVQQLNDNSGFSSDNNDHRPPFVAEIDPETAESASECVDLKSSYNVEQNLQNADRRSNLSADGSSPADDKDVRLRVETVADSDHLVSSEPSTDRLPTTTTVEQLPVTGKVSCSIHHRAGSSELSQSSALVHSVLADDAGASAVQQTVSYTDRLPSTDTVDKQLTSALNTALVDVILEAEQNLLSFLGKPCNRSCNNSTDNKPSKCDITCNARSIVPDNVCSIQTFVSDAKGSGKPLNPKLKCDNSHAVCTCQNYYPELPKNCGLGDQICDLSVNGTVGGEGWEKDEMAWTELKVLAEMLHAEQRLLVQLDCTSVSLQVA